MRWSNPTFKFNSTSQLLTYSCSQMSTDYHLTPTTYLTPTTNPNCTSQLKQLIVCKCLYAVNWQQLNWVPVCKRFVTWTYIRRQVPGPTASGKAQSSRRTRTSDPRTVDLWGRPAPDLLELFPWRSHVPERQFRVHRLKRKTHIQLHT